MLLTQEIGSLSKPNWRVKYVRGEKLEKEDLKELRRWAEFLEIEEDLVKKVEEGKAEKKEVVELSALMAIRLLEKAGLDIVFDGEQFRTEMYEYPLRYVSGFRFLGPVRSFDNKYYNRAECVDKPRLLSPYHVEEFLFTRRNTKRRVKVPITGPYTLAEWSYNKYYVERYRKLGYSWKNLRKPAKREFVLDLAKEVIRPNIAALIDKGAEIIQIDEPAVTTKPDEVDIFVEAFNEMTSGLNCKFSIHICYSDYSLLFPHVYELKGKVQLALEFANRGIKGYDILSLFKEYDGEIGLGVVDVHTDDVESPDTVKERILYASKFIPPERIYVNPDCGLRTRSWEIAYRKLKNMVKGAEMAREELK